MKTFRCSMCNICWPHEDRFKQCAQCGHMCWPKDTDPEKDNMLTVEEADRRLKQAQFEKYCEKRDREAAAYEIKRLEAGDVTVADIVGTA